MSTVKELLRPNIRDLKPYSSARDEYQGKASISLDANENPYNIAYTRYPDPLQKVLRQRLGKMRGVSADHVFTGNGSDEAIDLIIRAFCEPAVDNIVAISPTYGMYKVAADVNNVEYRPVNLNPDTLDLDGRALVGAADEHTKVIFLCSPNNPTGNLLNKDEIFYVLSNFNGIVVIDEAYIDFSYTLSFAADLTRSSKMIVLQTLSKAWGAAGIRLGMAYASPEIIAVLNRIKYPYNVNQLTQTTAMQRIFSDNVMKDHVKEIVAERNRISAELKATKGVVKVYPSDANFILVKFADANLVYNYLLSKKIIVRHRGSMPLCENCLRITIGTPAENKALLEAIRKIL
jgi:histidinol-phosphate aminotransferase